MCTSGSRQKGNTTSPDQSENRHLHAECRLPYRATCQEPCQGKRGMQTQTPTNQTITIWAWTEKHRGHGSPHAKESPTSVIRSMMHNRQGEEPECEMD